MTRRHMRRRRRFGGRWRIESSQWQELKVWICSASVSSDRLLCRLFTEPNPPWVLKGGYSLELKFATARQPKTSTSASRLECFTTKAIVQDLELEERDWAADLLAGYFSQPRAPWERP